ncbi:hypothetical protein ACIPSE_25065 [Streptomyces sp. NPDC090106]|uniref:hypothetical protein n=1 Tax=Streptomyces sp. NPDC090106 TaxID=3365946 RepID=UPI0038013B8B
MEWADWTQVMRGRVYGADHEDAGPRPDRVYGELVGGPLDGLLLDITGRPEPELRAGVELRTEIGAHGPGGRARYALRAGRGRYLDWREDLR